MSGRRGGFGRLDLLFRDLVARRRQDRDVEREFAFHLEKEIEQNVRRGMSRRDAEASARRSFGNVSRHRQASRDARSWQPAQRAVGDVRHALRSVRRNPAFSAGAVATLSLGLGATAAIFSVVDAVLLRPLPYPDGDRIVRVGWDFGEGGVVDAVSPLKFRHVAEHARSIEALATRRAVSFTLGEESDGPIVVGQRVSPTFFGVMGVQPAQGRAFTTDESAAGAPVVVVSHRLWDARFGSDPGLLGSSILLDDEPYTVIGIMPEAFRLVDLPDSDQLFLPFRFPAGADEDRGNNYAALGRLSPDATRERAVAELATLGATFLQAYPDRADPGESYSATDYLGPFVSDRLRHALWGFLAAAGFVLLIACANVISLFLVRAQFREREFSLRAVHGAPAGRLARQVLAESLVLAAAATVVGALLAGAALRAFLALVPASLPRSDTIAIDLRALAVTALVATVCAFVAGLPAALPAARARLLDALAGGRSGVQGRQRRATVRRALVAGQIGTSFVLLAGAIGFALSFRNFTSVDLGFRPAGLFSVEFDRTRQPPAEDVSPAVRMERELLPAVVSLPGVRSASLSASAPLERGLNFPVTLVQGDQERSLSIELRAVSSDYMETLPLPAVWGRAFDATDTDGAEPVAVLNRALADLVAEAGRDATLRIGYFRGEQVVCPECPPRRVVGVVEDVKEVSPDTDVRPTAYVPTLQVGDRFSRYGLPRLLVRTDGPPPSLDAIEAAARPLGFVREARVRPVPELLAATLAVDRFNASLTAAFAVVAVAITAVGLYGFLAYMVGLRRREAGVRLALGATRGGVARELTASGLVSVVIGLVLGLGLTVVVSRFVTFQLFETTALDARVLAGTCVMLLLVAAVASIVPARRATRIDPAGLLRED